MQKHNFQQVKWNIIFILTAFLVAAVDQLSKWAIQSNFYPGQSMPETGFFRLTYAQNTGAAFSIFYDQVGMLTVISTLGVILLLVYNFAISHRFSFLNTPLNKIVLGLILGGTSGNLIDRIWLGYVRDFLDFGLWPIFNVADSCVVIGVIIFAVSILFFSRYSATDRNQ
jgi:signal peptidase II